MAKESGIAKSIGDQNEQDMQSADQMLVNFLLTGKKISKVEAGYKERRREQGGIDQTQQQTSCDKCKFNLPAEKLCHIVEGEVNNEEGISKYFSPRGHGMLPGDILWHYVNQKGEKLNYEKGRVIDEAAEGFQCKDCKYYLDSHECSLLKGKLEPEMSCAFIVKIGNGIKL
ncbi:hypothetical protein [Candidatus Nitrosocosmicus arcticus]|uniref:Uncharacterized protein n=1 Tax=Candidatus Nitrosocosmicus arcticus TaxID=2035267 RepID=A0A557SZ82_9ARCH|nr:hypothetical protein [Candidatus Nitrosocosmicus arcticus]TVP41914.1 hypothetical protein NARC_10320 [Candidatus Nitrosocosmicus arcticus]